MKTTKMIRAWIMTSLIMATVLGVPGFARATVIAYDDLEDAAPGSLSGQTSGTGFTAGYALASTAIGIVTNKSLSYTKGDISIDGGTNCIMVSSPNTAYTFNRAIGTQNADELYLSFLFQTPTADGNSDEDFLSLGFGTSATKEPTAGVLHRLNEGKTDHYFGLRGMTINDDKKTTLGTVPNETYFIVFRLRKLTPGANEKYNELSLFVNPDSVYEPTPTLVHTNISWTAATVLSCRVALLEVGDKYFLDNLRIGESYDDVVFPNGPVVAKPTVSPNGGDFEGSVMITLSNKMAGASMRYTTDGSTPSSTVGTLYTGPFSLSDAGILRAIAYQDGLGDSIISEIFFRISHTKAWTGLGSDHKWSTAANWNTAGDPTGGDLVFGTNGWAATSVINNIVDADITISSLAYTNTTTTVNTQAYTTEIDPAVTLTIDGSTAPDNALLVGGSTLTGLYYAYVNMVGGGNLVIDADSSDLLLANLSTDNAGRTYFDISGLNALHASVKNFYVAFGQRSYVEMNLPSFEDGTNIITTSALVVGDSKGDTSTETQGFLNLGRHNEINANNIYVGAMSDSSIETQCGQGHIRFQNLSDGETPTVRIRAKDGVSRAGLAMARLGSTAQLKRKIRASVDFRGGIVDALLGDVLISEPETDASDQYGSEGTLSMGAGTIDVTSLTLGRSIYRSTAPSSGLGVLNVAGGVFRAGAISLAENIGTGGSIPQGVVNVSESGCIEVSGNVTMGTASSAPSIIATVTLTNGTMTVLGNMAPASASTNIISTVILAGGDLFVTNATDSATLRIERGTFKIAAGTAQINKLVMTNALATTQVTLSGISAGDYGQVVVTEEVLLGGNLNVAFNDYAIHGGESWTIVDGAGTRTGKFATANLPEGMKLRYTNNGYNLVCPAQGTVLVIR